LPFAILSSLVGVLFVAVPAMHYASGEVITVEAAFRELLRRPGRYLLAGLLFSLVAAVGFVLCIVPGILVALVMPIYVNRIFLTDQPITDAFAASFQAVYRSANGGSFVLLEILAWLLVALVSVCSCGLGALLAVPVSTFYLQNAAYHKGLIS
jgi:membrane protein YqaA with SNARE-associated domain